MVASGPREQPVRKTCAARSESSQTLENGARNAKSRELALSAFCVNWLTGSFRAKILSSLSATLFELPRKTRASRLCLQASVEKVSGTFSRFLSV
jgi:hypothetical protein